MYPEYKMEAIFPSGLTTCKSGSLSPSFIRAVNKIDETSATYHALSGAYMNLTETA